MPNRTFHALLVAALACATWSAAHAGASRLSPDRAGLGQAPPKECSRLNGRIGYYANPWCTPAEQRAWDVWEARMLRRSAGK
jgi:hypothetical protein